MTRPPAISTLRDLTIARVALGRSGVSLPTRPLLDFTLHHARARDAVHAGFDAHAIASGLASLGLGAIEVSSQAQDRRTYLTRPDLGRQLDPASRALLDRRAGEGADVVIIVGDGLSPHAVHAHALAVVGGLLDRFRGVVVDVGMAVVASGARVALGDEIGDIAKAKVALVLIGERPGLSAPHSLGAYITFAPRPGLTDAGRNCVSNIHAAGLGHDEAALKIAWLVRAALSRGVSGVALKDESGLGLLADAGCGQ